MNNCESYEANSIEFAKCCISHLFNGECPNACTQHQFHIGCGENIVKINGQQ